MNRTSRYIRYRGAVYVEARTIHDLTSEYIGRLKKNDWVRVFHGTHVSKYKTGPQSMVFGIDATRQSKSHYHSQSYQYQGLYVAPDLKTAQRFGHELTFEFTVHARNLHATTWSGNIPRRNPENGDHSGPWPATL